MLAVVILSVGIPILRSVGVIRTDEELRFELDDREKHGDANDEPPWSTGKRLALAGILFLLFLALIACITIIDMDELLAGIGRLALPAAVVGAATYVAAGILVRKRGKDYERHFLPTAFSGRAPATTLSSLIEASTNLDWRPYSQRSRWRGRLILVTGAILELACVGVAAALLIGWVGAGLRANRLLYILAIIPISVAILIATKLGRAARQHYTFAELTRMAATQLPPVLYLRSFVSDHERFDNPGNTHSNPARWIDWQVEGVLAQELRLFGPVLAVGQPNPNDKAAPLRAGRLYVASDWRNTVRTLCDISRLTIVRPASSSGIEWELIELLSPHRRHRTAILLVDDAGEPMNKGFYSRLSRRLRELSGIELPERGWNSWFLWFDGADTPHLVHAGSPGDRDGLAAATRELVAQRRNYAHEEWTRLSLWDPFTPPEYRLLSWLPPVALVGLLGLWLFQ